LYINQTDSLERAFIGIADARDLPHGAKDSCMDRGVDPQERDGRPIPKRPIEQVRLALRNAGSRHHPLKADKGTPILDAELEIWEALVDFLEEPGTRELGLSKRLHALNSGS
jgi:hypothetical protein